MARPRQDGTPAREVNRRKLTDLFVSSRKAQERPELIWDLKQPGLALSVRPTSKKAWKVIYHFFTAGRAGCTSAMPAQLGWQTRGGWRRA